MLENILIKVFTNGFRDKKSRERVLLYKPNTLPEAAKYAQFSEAVVRVVHNRSSTACAASSKSVNTMNITNRGRRGQRGHSAPPLNNQRGRGGYYSRGQFRGRYFSRGRGMLTPHQNNSQFNNRGSGYFNYASVRGYRCFNCNRMGHIARNCRVPKQQYFQQRGVGNRERGGYQNRVSAVNQRGLSVVQEGKEEATGGPFQTTSCINSVPAGTRVISRFSQSRKLSAVPGIINGTHLSQILIDCGSPVTIILSDLWEEVRESADIVEQEPEDFQGFTRDGLRILGLTRLKLKFGGIVVTHPVIIAEAIAHKFILGNDFLTEYKCDIFNSEGSILFGDQRVPSTLFRSTVNLICPVISTSATTICPHEEAIIPAFLDASSEYMKGESILLEPRNDEKFGSLIGGRVLVNFTSSIVPVLLTNLSRREIIIPRNKVLADDYLVVPDGSVDNN